jgi:hypothetical protein
MPECCKECFLLMAIKIDVKASAATELHKGPACQPFKPASAASSITVALASRKSPDTRTSQSIYLSVCNNSAEIF